MKKIISTFAYILILTLSMNCNAQPPQDGENRLNNNINKFVGTWNWSSGNNSFQLTFKKENIKDPYMNINFHYDTLIGFHKFVNNGIVIENSTQFTNTNYLDKKWTIISSDNHPNELKGVMTHLSKNKSVNFKIEYIDATHVKLVKLQNTAGIKFRQPSDPPFDGSITLPQNIILTKQ